MSEQIIKDHESARLVPVTPRGDTAHYQRNGTMEQVPVSALEGEQRSQLQRSIAGALREINAEVARDDAIRQQSYVSPMDDINNLEL